VFVMLLGGLFLLPELVRALGVGVAHTQDTLPAYYSGPDLTPPGPLSMNGEGVFKPRR
jgi:hypothetical protein